MSEFPSNSRFAKKPSEDKKERPKVERIVSGDVTRKKKSLGKKVSETFLPGDVDNVRSYVVDEVLIPSAKDMIVDAIIQTTERMVFGETRSRSRTASAAKSAFGNISYNRFSSPSSASSDRDRSTISHRSRATHSFDEIVISSRAEAHAVIDSLQELASRYGQATVNDLYDMVGVTGDFTSEKWGWDSLEGSRVVRTRDGGYLLDLPKPMELR